MDLEKLQNKLGLETMVEVLDETLTNTLTKAIEYELDGDFKMAEELYAKADETGHSLANEAYTGFKLRLMTHKAKGNDKEAQYSLGQRYETGMGVPVDRNKALEWYKKAAEQEYPQAMLKMGDFARDNKDWVQARKWYIDAATNDVSNDQPYKSLYRLNVSQYKAENQQNKENTEHKQEVPQTQPQTPLHPHLSHSLNNPMYVYEFFDYKGLKLYEIAEHRVFSIETEYGEKREKDNKSYILEIISPKTSNNHKRVIKAFSYKLKAY